MEGPLVLPLPRSQPLAAPCHVYDEPGMSVRWLGKKMGAFGPAQAIVKRYLPSFQEWPPVSTAALANQKNLEGMLEDGVRRR